MSLVEIVQINHYSEQYSNVISGNSTKERKYQRVNQKTHVKERHNDLKKEEKWTNLQMIYKTLHRKPMIE
jgi:hypothetical protein